MKAVKASLYGALDKPASDVRFYLFYGPDEAASRALVSAFAAAAGAGAERVELTGSSLREDPARLADEAASISMFGGSRYIVVDPAGDESTAAAEALAPGDNCEPLGGVEEKKSDLSIKKEAKGCVLIPGGWFCAFTVILTNEGPDDFYGPLKLHESMSVAPIGAPVFSPPWICAAGGGDYDCDYPAGLQVPLAPLDTMSLDVGVLVPDES